MNLLLSRLARTPSAVVQRVIASRKTPELTNGVEVLVLFLRRGRHPGRFLCEESARSARWAGMFPGALKGHKKSTECPLLGLQMEPVRNVGGVRLADGDVGLAHHGLCRQVALRLPSCPTRVGRKL